MFSEDYYTPSPPPMPPRKLPSFYTWRTMSTDGWAIVAGVLLIIGATFCPIAIPLIASGGGVVVGAIILIVGGLFIFPSLGVLLWRYGETRKKARVLREGQAALGRITGIRQNFSIMVNGRHPWIITYRFDVFGRQYEGRLTTLVTPDWEKSGVPVYVLYDPDDPNQNMLYIP